MSNGVEEQTTHTKDWDLEPETEYRFELDPGTTLALTLLSGKAEIFGAEIGEGITYLFGYELFGNRSKLKQTSSFWFAFFLYVTGKPSTEYVSDETPMAAYMNLHLAFEHMRVKALSSTRNSPPPDEPDGLPDGPPRILVLGPEDAGKTTACKILTNYAVRAGQGWSPMFVNVDPSEGGWTVPGTLSACPIDSPIHTNSPASPLGFTATSTPSALSTSALLPIVYWFGHSESRRNPLLMDRLIRNLGESVIGRLDGDPKGRSSGIIIDTPSSFATGVANASGQADKKYSSVRTCVEAFQINVILVIGHEKLNVEMQRMFGSSVTVVKVPKSGGVVDLDLAYRDRIQRYQIHNYMYGQHLTPPPGLSAALPGFEELTELSDTRLNPLSTTISFDDLTLYRIGGGEIAPSSALPIGAQRTVSELQPILVDPSQKGSGLLNAVLALLSYPNSDENERYDEEVLDLTVSAFIYVTAIDIPNRKLTVLEPSPGTITGRIALVGSFEWQDT